MKGRSPTADEKRWMDKVSRLGCIVCLDRYGSMREAEIHHLRGKTVENAHFWVIPLCTQHHRGGEEDGLFTSRHPWKRRFENQFGEEETLWKTVCERIGETPCDFP